MLENLKQHFKDAFTTEYKPEDTQYEWFTTEQGETFGINRTSLTNKEKDILTALFHSVNMVETDQLTVSQRNWLSYLLHDHHTHAPLSPKQSLAIRFYYFFLNHPMEEKQNFEEAVKGIINSDLILWLSSSHGIIIQEHPEMDLELESIKDFIDTLISDFYIEPYFYIGQIQKNDNSLKTKFSLEHTCFQTLHRFTKRDKVLTFHQALPLLVITAPSSIKRDVLSNHLIEAIEDKELLHTIEAFLHSNLNASSTAKRLFIHRNSLQYRLEKLIEKTGLDIRIFSNAIFMHLAIMLTRHE